jgi:AmmeMemoRadiSam system protein A
MEEKRLTIEERKALLSLVRSTLADRLRGKGSAAAPELAGLAGLAVPRGAFVTLTEDGELRGCIGTFRADRPLSDVVRQMALQAALHDPRFEPVRAEELDRLEVEVSALTPLREIKDVSEIEVGRHGIYITRGVHGGVLLPQVAVEWGWGREEFLAHTCLKAGLPPDAWKKGATIEIFSAEVFSEEDIEGKKVVCGK